MIFLSAGIPNPTPIPGREFFGKGNVPAIREAVSKRPKTDLVI